MHKYYILIFSLFTIGFIWKPSLALSDEQNNEDIKIEAFPLRQPGGLKRQSSDTTLIYGCKSNLEDGICVPSHEECRAPGRFVGFCFVKSKYEGLCCLGLNPANSTLELTGSSSSVLPAAPNDQHTAITAKPPPQINLPALPSFPSVTAIPSLPGISVPAVPSIPNLPQFPGDPIIPTTIPTVLPTLPTNLPTSLPIPTTIPSFIPTTVPTSLPIPTTLPSFIPTTVPTSLPIPTTIPTEIPTSLPIPTTLPSFIPTTVPTSLPIPTTLPSFIPTTVPTSLPIPTTIPTDILTSLPIPTTIPSFIPTTVPTSLPIPTTLPTFVLTTVPTSFILPTTIPTIPLPSILSTVKPTPSSATIITALPSVYPLPGSPISPSSPVPIPIITPTISPALPQPAAVTESVPDEIELIPGTHENTDPSCSVTTSEILSEFVNPSYPAFDTLPNLYQYDVIPQKEYCALRLEFKEALLAGKNGPSCSTDSIQIINSEDNPTVPQCGLLEGYQITVRTQPEKPVRIVVTTQSTAHIWNITVSQIKCSRIIPVENNQPYNCGVKNSRIPPIFAILEPEIKSIPSIRLLKSPRSVLDTYFQTSVTTSLLRNAALRRQGQVKIVRGNETAPNEWPWQALLMVNGKPLCGASIINEQWLVTAGHCVNLNLLFPLKSVLTVDLADHDLRTTSETKNFIFRVDKIVPHPKYESVYDDIALIKLADRIPLRRTMRPVCLPIPHIPVNTYVGEIAIATGWGRTEDSVISPVLRQAELTVISNAACQDAWGRLGDGGGSVIDKDKICVGGGDVGPCNGDSGGPLVVFEDKRWRLIGLTSFGSIRGCALPGIPAVYTRISSFLDWISLNIAD